jgi:thymidylate synthase (FAD)
VRAIRHVIEMRTAPGAEEEIRIIADQIGQIMVEQCPLLFGDYEFDADSAPTAWVTPNRKV